MGWEVRGEKALYYLKTPCAASEEHYPVPLAPAAIQARVFPSRGSSSCVTGNEHKDKNEAVYLSCLGPATLNARRAIKHLKKIIGGER